MTEADSVWGQLYQRSSGLILGFHGCDRIVGEKILSGKDIHLKPSVNEYDWLGHGIYFWENSPARAYEFAVESKKKPLQSKGAIKNPFVIGAVIDLGLCLNLTESTAIKEVVGAHSLLINSIDDLKKIPQNNIEKGLRSLDCAVVQTLHAFRARMKYPAYDTVRGMFVEGNEIYSNAGFREKDHVQICVCNTKSIRGYFRPIKI